MRVLFIFLTILGSLVYATEPIKFALTGQKSETPETDNSILFNTAKYELIQKADEFSKQEIESIESRRSGVKAAFFSALIPGAGEVYAKSYWRAALFAGIEIALWTSNIMYENKGDDEDKKMRAFGDVHWDERVYWSKVYQKAVESDEWGSSDPTVSVFTDNQKREIIADEYYTDEVIAALRTKESKVGYTHSLPETKTQQYYEMIYKYLHQFGVGWDDVDQTFGDPYYYDYGNNYVNPTNNVKTYRKIRNRSNDYYETASTMLNLALLNHLLSAFDAAIAVKQYNKKLNYAVRVNQELYGLERVTTYGLYLSW